MLRAKVKLSGLLSVAGDVRRMYVDVHVKRVWEKIAERETKNKTMVPTKGVSPQVKSVFTTVTHSEIVASSFGEEPQTTRTDSVSVQHTDEPSLDASSQSQSSLSPSQTVSEPEAPTQIETKPEPEPEPETPIESSVPVEEVPAAEEVALEEEQTEVDDFLKQLGLDETVASDPDSIPPPEDQEPEQEQQPEQDPALLHAKALQETAFKRADITSRHARWQAELDRSVEELDVRVRGVLIGMREGAVRELRDVHNVGAVEDEGQRLVKGLEAFVRKVRMGKGKGKGDGKEKEMWEKVVDKVEQKFWEKADAVQKEVREWYAGVREREVGEVGSFFFFCLSFILTTHLQPIDSTCEHGSEITSGESAG